jgi:hypothetical protein
VKFQVGLVMLKKLEVSTSSASSAKGFAHTACW